MSAPREKPVMVTVKERPLTYTHLEDDVSVTTHGREIVKEAIVRLCTINPERAAQLEGARQPTDPALYVSLSEGRFAHARKCKKLLDECIVCQGNMKFFAELPLHVLSYILEEVRFR